MKKIIVFGGSGFIGSHVVDNLLAKGFEVTIFARQSFNKGNILAPHEGYRFFLGDIKDREAVNHAVSKHDGVINLAGILGTSETVDNPWPSVEVNILGALNIMQAVKQYNLKAVQITVGNHWMNNSYSITKSTAERFALMFNKEHGTKIAVVRGLNAYGPRQKHMPVRKITPNFIIPALQKRAIKINGNGEQIMDMIFVKDVAEVLVRALTVDHDIYDKVFEAGSGVRTSVNFIAETINKIAGCRTPVEHVPMRPGEPENAVVMGDLNTLLPLWNKKDSKVIYYPDFKSLREGMKETVDWYRNYYPWKDAV